jgi:hypothetical protein
MATKAYDVALAARIRAALAGRGSVTEKEMFGGIAFMVGGHMLVGVMKPGFGANPTGGMMVRVGPAAHATALREPHVTGPTMAGRPMAGYVIVAAEGVGTDRAVASWIERGWAFVRMLPPKPPGARSKMKAKPAAKATPAAKAKARPAAKKRS